MEFDEKSLRAWWALIERNKSDEPSFPNIYCGTLQGTLGHDRFVRMACQLLPHLRVVPVESFLWSRGEPSAPWHTKIGGVPYRDASRPWPVNKEGTPLEFLAQVFITQSSILTKSRDFPGDVLLLFADGDVVDLSIDVPDDFFVFEWVKVGEVSSLLAKKNLRGDWLMTSVVCHSHLFPTLEVQQFIESDFDTIVYSKAWEEWGLGEFAQIDEDRVGKVRCCKIAGLPLRGQETVKNVSCESGEHTFLFAIKSVGPTFDRIFPWLNVAEPISVDEAWSEDNEMMFYANIAINVFLDQSDKIVVQVVGG